MTSLRPKSVGSLAALLMALALGAPALAHAAKVRAPAPAAATRPSDKAAAMASAAQKLARTRVVGPYEDPRTHLPAATPGKRRLVFGVMGGAGPGTPESVRKSVRGIGRGIGRSGSCLLTGACPGLPQDALLAGKKAGATTIGISPWSTIEAHVTAGAPVEGFDVLQLTELPPALRGQARANYMGREIDNIERSDIIIIVGGRFGTLGELAIALDERKPVGVLVGSGGIADVARQMIAASTSAGKPPGAPVIYDRSPSRLVKRLIAAEAKHRAKGGSAPFGDHTTKTR